MEYRDVLSKKLIEIGESNDKVVLLDADVGTSTRLSNFKRIDPNRFIQCGIAEQNMVGVGAGLALKGFIPFVGTFSVFMANRALDQIRVSVSYANLNVKLVGTHAGISPGGDGPTHFSINDVAVIRSLPNMIVVEPADDMETEMILENTIITNGPVYIRISRTECPHIYSNVPKFGKINILEDGEDLALISSGMMVSKALNVAEELRRKGYHPLVADIHMIKPIDGKTLTEIAQKCKKIFTIENHSIIGGIGSAVTESIQDSSKIHRIGIEDIYPRSGSLDELLQNYGLDEAGILNKIIFFMEGSR